MEYEEAVERIYDLDKFRGDITLDPIEEAVERMGEPHTDFDSVHVAGTNGKGSTATILASVLEEAGYTTGLFTSPHLVDFRERMRVDGEKITKDEVVERFSAVESTDVELSFFEAMTAMAFDHFSRKDVDVAVVETGMGGEVDATNVIRPEASVITNVAREHTKWLGESREEIAGKLAGVVKEGTPVVSGVEGDARKVIREAADEKGSEFRQVGERVERTGSRSMELELEVAGEVVETNLVGRYQVDNVDTVLEVLDVLPMEVSGEEARTGIGSASVEGRMEPVSLEPLVLLDGAHNPAGMERVPETLEEVDGGRTISVVSVMGDKEYGEMVSTIEGFSDLLVFSEASIERASDAAELASCAEGTESEVRPSIEAAVRSALDSASPRDTVLFTGSLYFVGDVRKVLDDARLP